MEAIRQAAAAIREQDRETADRRTRELELAEVRKVEPLTVVLHEANFTLDEEDLLYTAWVRAYDSKVGIKKGDTITVKKMRDDGWLVTDVMAQQGEILFGEGEGTGDGEDKYYPHDQSTPSAVWNIPHGLGKNPAVQAFNTAGSELTGKLEHIDLNNSRLTFNHANAGKARCN